MARAPMTVGKLIKMLQDFDENDEVHISYNSGNYWRTQLAPSVSEVDTVKVKFSDYSRMDVVADESDEEKDDDEEQDETTNAENGVKKDAVRTVVVIS